MPPENGQETEEQKKEVQEEDTHLTRAEAKEADVKAELAEELGLDPESEVDKDVLDKAVQRELVKRQEFGKLTTQKRKYREAASSQRPSGDTPKEGETPAPTDAPEKKPEEQPSVQDEVQRQLDKRDLDALEYSDDIKKEIEDYAGYRKISVKEAEKASHIQTLIKDEEDSSRAAEASIGKDKKPPTTQDMSKIEKPNFDLSTEEGREQYDEWKRQKIARESAGG